MTLLGIVCCVHNISDHCNVIGGWCVCDHLVAGGHPLGLTITLSSSAQSITINYHNSSDHWLPPLSPGSSAWSAVSSSSSAPSSPIWWWHISTHVRVCLIMRSCCFVLTVCFYTDLTNSSCHFSCCGLWMVAFFAIWKYFFNLSLQAKQWRLRAEDNGWDSAPRHQPQPRSLDVRPRHTLWLVSRPWPCRAGYRPGLPSLLPSLLRSVHGSRRAGASVCHTRSA